MVLNVEKNIQIVREREISRFRKESDLFRFQKIHKKYLIIIYIIYVLYSLLIPKLRTTVWAKTRFVAERVHFDFKYPHDILCICNIFPVELHSRHLDTGCGRGCDR